MSTPLPLRNRCRLLLPGAALAAALLATAPTPAVAGLRWLGKYTGVVLFDRWDACTLYSGIYVMYVSEQVKAGLRPYAGQAVQLDATDVSQPINPGDGLIRAFRVLGDAPDTDDWLGPVAGLGLATDLRFVGGRAEVRLTVRNDSDRAVTVHADHLAPTLLARAAPPGFLACHDGPSVAVLTRCELFNQPFGTCVRSGRRLYWRVTSGPVRGLTPLAPGQRMVTAMLLNAPPGEYQFLFGYGGGCQETRCVASNLVSFDVGSDGRATAVP